ncbi:MAG TPA: hypothetical protein VE261_06990, partial [Gaiellaceae bacterium]|nr:hypothetical protein [Gaiellaceae bacterium]
MKRVALTVAVLAALASATAATSAGPPGAPGSPRIYRLPGSLPFYQSGTSLGEGIPVKAYARLSPTVALFGTAVTAKLAVVADTRYVDPVRLRVFPLFKPFRSVGPPRITRLRVGRFAEVTWTWTLRCLTSPCVPRIPPSDRFHVFSPHPIKIV